MKVALITGASGAIGSETVKKFVDSGYFVVGQYNGNLSSTEKLKKYFSDKGKDGYFFPVKADLNVVKDAENLYEYAKNNFGHIDVFVHVAGVDVFKLLTETTEEEWDKIFNVNVKSAFILSKHCIPEMVKRKSGKIVFVSSIWGKSGASMESAYSASKASLIGLTKSLAKELAPSNINVNCVCPGVIDTPMNARFNGDEMEDLIERTPLKRLGTAIDVANAVYFLSSEKASFITGESITIDGGFIL